jgi:hypothetical protein
MTIGEQPRLRDALPLAPEPVPEPAHA